MGHLQLAWRKVSTNGSTLEVLRDGHAAWFVARPADRQSGAPPLGAFRSAEAAKRWADHAFPGGQWEAG